MHTPPASSVPVFLNCRACRDIVRIPPGVYYNGEGMHKECAMIEWRRELSESYYDPRAEEAKRICDEIHDVTRIPNPWA